MLDCGSDEIESRLTLTAFGLSDGKEVKDVFGRDGKEVKTSSDVPVLVFGWAQHAKDA